ncbi:PqqD family protein [Mesorhizobium sp.]|uniref:PqqD family protein n=1 Tax=Mesorhizobium sp. TaxID=1871066 RepID=UPI00257D7607|nr:PqqD family protein [Mesorhizobium sp.]
MAKAPYVGPSFISVPIANICSKSGCVVKPATSIPLPIDNKTTTPADPLVIVPGDLESRADKERLFIFEPTIQLVFELNDTAGQIIKHAEGGRRISEIETFVKSKYTNVPKDCAALIWGFLQQLKAAGFRMTIVE